MTVKRKLAPAEKPPIKKTPGVCDGTARITGTRIPVWVIEQCRRLRMRVKDILQDYPSIGADDVRAAWEYADRHPNEIERQLRQNRNGS